MNGLEAVALMHEGKTAHLVDSDLIYCIQNGTVMSKRISSEKWVKNLHFDFQVDYEEYIDPKELTGWERLDNGEEFFYHNVEGIVWKSKEAHFPIDDNMHEAANYFSTKEKAEEINFKQTLFRKLQRFSDENGGNEIDLCKRASTIIFDSNGSLEVINVWSNQFFGNVVFASNEIAQKAIELFHDDLIKYFTGDFGGKS